MDSWKAIADFLNRSPRTVQRWNVQFGLPVYRVTGNNSSVFAFKEELHQWLTRHSALSNGPSNQTLVAPRPAHIGAVSGIQIARPTGSYDPAGGPDPRACAAALVETGYALWRISSTRNLAAIAQRFREAADYDPQNAAAYAGLAHALIAQGFMGLLHLPQAYQGARTAAERALELEPNSAESRSAAAWVKLVLERDWEGARRLFEPLVAKLDGNGRAMVGWAMLHIGAGRAREGADILYQACLKDPLIPARWALRAWASYLAGEYQQAREQIDSAVVSGNHGRLLFGVEALLSMHTDAPERSIALIQELIQSEPSFPLLRGALGYAYAKSGDQLQARATLQQLSDRGGRSQRMPHYAMAMILVALGDHDEAVMRLEHSHAAGSLWSFGFHSDPAFRPLGKHPEFRDFLRRAYPSQLLFQSSEP